MSIKMAMWLHGNGAQYENYPYSQRRMAGSGLFGGADRTKNWFHFPITTPVIVDDKRLKLTKVFVHYRLKFSIIKKVHLFDGRTRIAEFDVENTSLVRAVSGLLQPAPDYWPAEFEEKKTMFSLETPVEIRQALSVSVNTNFESEIIDGTGVPNLRHLGSVEFFSAGADFE